MSKPTPKQMMQANVLGFGGKPATVLGLYDPDNDTLTIAKAPDYKRERVKESLVITNDQAAQVRDALFTADDFQAAINAYIAMRDGYGRDGATKRLILAADVERFNPRAAIDLDGYTETGARYKVNPDTSNGQVAVLAMCWHASKASGMYAAMSFAQELAGDDDDDEDDGDGNPWAKGWVTID